MSVVLLFPPAPLVVLPFIIVLLAGSLVFLFVGIILGVATLHFITRKAEWVPYSCALLLEGIVLSLLHEGSHQGLGSLSRSIETWQNIDAHLIPHAFLPALLSMPRIRAPRTRGNQP